MVVRYDPTAPTLFTVAARDRLTLAAADLRATLAYAAYLGHAQLPLTTPGALPRTSRARKELIDELAAVLLG